jgi:hypothetical protein
MSIELSSHFLSFFLLFSPQSSCLQQTPVQYGGTGRARYSLQLGLNRSLYAAIAHSAVAETSIGAEDTRLPSA